MGGMKRKKMSEQKPGERIKRVRRGIALELAGLAALSFLCFGQGRTKALSAFAQRLSGAETQEEEAEKDGFIKWVEFNVTAAALEKAYEIDVATYEKDVHVEWIPLLAYEAARTGGKFNEKALKDMEETAGKLEAGEATLDGLTGDMKYYPYYLDAYTAALGGMVGKYRVEALQENGSGKWEERYGLKAFSPIAKGFEYSDFDDFGTSRSYGYSRPHLGHDMMGLVGTPIIAVESGYVEALGWNQYGGWRIGIRSFDKKRYYYYAHLRQNFPYCKDLQEGSVVTAGDVIGYMGHTGYSATENVNNIKVTHLHFGLQLIFDESQKEGDNEIWIDCYELTKFLSKNRSEAAREEETKEWRRTARFEDPAALEFEKKKER